MPCLSHLRLMADYNHWMNRKLYQAAASLPAAELVADKQAFFGSIMGALNHLVVADTIWLKRYVNHPAKFPALEPLRAMPMPSGLGQQPFTDLQAWDRHRLWLDGVIVDWSAQVTEDDLWHVLAYANTKGQAFNKEFFSLAMHLFNHQTHHRGQVTTLLTQAGVDIGSTDLVVLIPDL